MASRVPTHFRTTSPRVITGYDFTDAVTATGYSQFYFATGADQNLLTTFVIYSQDIVTTSASISSATYVTANDIDFDIPVSVPLTLKGLAITNVPVACRSGGSGVTNPFSRVTIKIRKWDGTTETELYNNVGTERNLGDLAADSNSGGSIDMIEVDITSEASFAPGDSIRITILQEAKVASNSAVFSFGNDPKDRDETSTSGFNSSDVTTSTILLPFKLNL